MMELTYFIVYLHGFRSDSSSNKVIILRDMFPDIEVVSLEYDPHKPILAAAKISDLLNANVDKQIVLIGTSLGGFWARWGAYKFFTQSLLINPSLHPMQTIKAGKYKCHKNTAISIEVTEDDLNCFIDYEVPSTSRSHAIVALAMNDEILDANKTFNELNKLHRVVCFQDGKHRFEQFSEIKHLVEEALYWVPPE